jgi:ubiquinone/menaquinone biosynthesis C-methylase UbiE
MDKIKQYISRVDYAAIVTDKTPLKYKNCWLLTFFLVIAVLTFGAVIIYHYEHTFVWFNSDLPKPEEVEGWDEIKRFNTLYKLSRWEGFVSGEHFNEYVRYQIAGLQRNQSDQFYFLEVGVGVGAFALEVLKMYPLSSGEGIDIVPGAIAIAEVVLPSDRMHVKVGDMRNIEYGASQFDVVYVPGALCYLLSMEDVQLAVSEFYRVLRPGGGICLSMLASDSSDTGSCNTRIPKTFWTVEMVDKYSFKVLRLDDMDDWKLPHSMGRYSICLKKNE